MRLDSLIKAVTTYRLPNVVLKDLAVEEVCPIFERINSSGTKLSTYDLMVAATWSNSFDLDEKVAEVSQALAPKGFEDIDKATVLKCLSALHSGSIKESSLKDLRDLQSHQLQELTARTKSALLRTVDLLATEFKIHSWDFLSYQALTIIIAYIFSRTDHLTSEQVTRLRQWFWRASFAERYKVGGESFVSNDLPKVVDFINSGGDQTVFGAPPTATEWLDITFRSNASRSRAFLLALALNRPRNLLSGTSIDTSVALSNFNKKQYHHIYPRAYLKREKSSFDDNLLLNICMLSASENLKISDSEPSKYLPDLIEKHGEKGVAIFESNLLPSPAEFDYAKLDYPDFIRARSRLVEQYAAKLCSGEI